MWVSIRYEGERNDICVRTEDGRHIKISRECVYYRRLQDCIAIEEAIITKVLEDET